MTDMRVISRQASRILLINSSDRVLLFRGYDPAQPRQWYWFTAGGGIEPGETASEAASRELYEETGLRASPGEFGSPVWRDIVEFTAADALYRQEQQFFVLRIDSWNVKRSGTPELVAIDRHRWWSINDLDVTTELYYPRQLPQLLRHLAQRASR